ncbi:Ubiquitin domain-containing protein UBFD1 [Mytilus edulis]|uniref:Ubiquitin domain-containing protein UBFD1 n=1 Tax=Mytilus edulis TaxID=6550 RepID=A0A8S3PW25_MYTED|nr:Ubiquitin domain-containing protein UBFD1 [Mytilus edulis]
MASEESEISKTVQDIEVETTDLQNKELENKEKSEDTGDVTTNESDSSIDTRQKVDFKVIFNKQKYDVTFPIDETIAKLKSHIETLTGVPSAMQKIMFKGLAKDESTLNDLKVTNGAKVMVVGSTLNDVLSVSKPSEKEIKEAAKSETSSKEPLSKLKEHKKVLDKYGKPDDALPGVKNVKEPLPPTPVAGMCNKSGGKVRLTFKLELDQVWIGTKGRDRRTNYTYLLPHRQKAGIREEGGNLGIQLGPTEASNYWIYWVPAQYVDAIKDTILGKWQLF